MLCRQTRFRFLFADENCSVFVAIAQMRLLVCRSALYRSASIRCLLLSPTSHSFSFRSLALSTGILRIILAHVFFSALFPALLISFTSLASLYAFSFLSGYAFAGISPLVRDCFQFCDSVAVHCDASAFCSVLRLSSSLLARFWFYVAHVLAFACLLFSLVLFLHVLFAVLTGVHSFSLSCFFCRCSA